MKACFISGFPFALGYFTAPGFPFDNFRFVAEKGRLCGLMIGGMYGPLSALGLMGKGI
jgi:hypothetical protein